MEGGDTKALQIIEAKTDDELVQAGKLFEEYADELGVDLGFQNFAHELQYIREVYRSAEGETRKENPMAFLRSTT